MASALSTSPSNSTTRASWSRAWGWPASAARCPSALHVSCGSAYENQLEQGKGGAGRGHPLVQGLGSFEVARQLPVAGQQQQTVGVTGVGSPLEQDCRASRVSRPLPAPARAQQGIRATALDGAPQQGLRGRRVSRPLPPLRQIEQGVNVARVGGPSEQGVRPGVVPGLPSRTGETQQRAGMTGVCGAVAEVVVPLEAVAGPGRLGEAVQVVGSGEMGVGRVPEGGGRAQIAANGAAVLFQVVGEPEHRPGRPGRGLTRARVARRTQRGPGDGAAQRGLLAVDGAGEFGERHLRPAVGPLVVFALAEVVGGGVDEEGTGQMETGAESARVHRHPQQGPGGGAPLFVAVAQLRGAGEVLCQLPRGAGARQGIGQQPVAGFGEGDRSGKCGGVEGLGDGQGAALQQGADRAVHIRLVRGGQGGVPEGVLGPQRAQDQYGPALGHGQQAAHGCRDPLARHRVAEVVLGLVQPHHRPRQDTVQVVQGLRRPCRVEGVPQPPPQRGERLHGLPARPGLPGRRVADQDHQPAVPVPGLPHRPRQHPIVLT
ncbi:hypothetical protein ACFXPT_17805 [Streptomyces goshikiensis]|uniref:hypothetical protein n=1 Tax=Streptomyces goshikiensis TaxID=1942 RepID=UPI0036D16A4B